MNTKEYESTCNQPNAFPRGTIEATERTLIEHPHLALKLREILNGIVIQKPVLHNGGKESDYFRIGLSIDEAEQIQNYLIEAEAIAVGLNGETTSIASHYASLADAWQKYIEFRASVNDK